MLAVTGLRGPSLQQPKAFAMVAKPDAERVARPGNEASWPAKPLLV